MHGWPDCLYGPYYARRLPGGDGPPKFRAQPSWYSCGSWGFVLLLEGCKSSIVVCVYLFFIEFLLFIYVRAINILIRFRASNLLSIPSQGTDAEPFFKFFFKIPLPFDLCLSETKWKKRTRYYNGGNCQISEAKPECTVAIVFFKKKKKERAVAAEGECKTHGFFRLIWWWWEDECFVVEAGLTSASLVKFVIKLGASIELENAMWRASSPAAS